MEVKREENDLGDAVDHLYCTHIFLLHCKA